MAERSQFELSGDFRSCRKQPILASREDRILSPADSPSTHQKEAISRRTLRKANAPATGCMARFEQCVVVPGKEREL